MAASRLVQTSRGFASLLFDSIRFDSPEAASNAFIGVRFRAGHSRCKKLLPRKEKRNRTAIGDYVHTMRSPTDLATRFVFFPFLFFFSFFFFFFFFFSDRGKRSLDSRVAFHSVIVATSITVRRPWWELQRRDTSNKLYGLRNEGTTGPCATNTNATLSLRGA